MTGLGAVLGTASPAVLAWAIAALVWAPDLDRLTLVLTLGGGLGLFLTGLVALAHDPSPVAAG